MESVTISIRCVPADQSSKPRVLCFSIEPSSTTLAQLRSRITDAIGSNAGSISMTFSLQGRELPAEFGSLTLWQVFNGSFQQELRAEYEVVEAQPSAPLPMESQAVDADGARPRRFAIGVDSQLDPFHSADPLDFTRKIQYPTYSVLKRDPNLECAICHDLLLDPIDLPCQHMFCRSCLGETAQSGLCALCRQPWQLRDLAKPHRILCQTIDRMEVQCSVCGMQVSRGLKGEIFKRHVEEDCSIPCPNQGCSWRGPFTLINHHVLQNCTQHLCSSHLCSFRSSYLRVQQHQANECPVFEISCPEGCGASFKRRDCSLHLKSECPKVAAEKMVEQERHRQQVDAAMTAQLASVNFDPSDIIYLSVSGNPVSICKEVISRFPDSLLPKLLTNSVKKDPVTQQIFLSHPYQAFYQMVTWLLTGIHASQDLTDSGALLFWKELCFWQLSQTDEALSIRMELFQNRKFRGQSLIGMDFSHCVIRRCSFESCNLQGVSFAFAKLIDVSFDTNLTPSLTDVNFYRVQARNSPMTLWVGPQFCEDLGPRTFHWLGKKFSRIVSTSVLEQDLFLRMIALDPEYAPAYVYLATTTGQYVEEDEFSLKNGEKLTWMQLLLKAIQLAPKCAVAYLLLATARLKREYEPVTLLDGTRMNVVGLLLKCIDCNPLLAVAYTGLASLMISQNPPYDPGQHPISVKLLNGTIMTAYQMICWAIHIDPSSPHNFRMLAHTISEQGTAKLIDGTELTRVQLLNKAEQLSAKT